LSLDQSKQLNSPNGKITPAVLFLLMPNGHLLNFKMPKGCVYFASRGKRSAGTILPSTNRIWLKAKLLQSVFAS